jgi:hypothetical protein
MSFTDQKQRIATERDCQARWSGNRPGENFRCYLCGHKFIPGDLWRWQYGSGRAFEHDGKRWGVCNFLVCDKCDGPDVLDTWVEMNRELKQRFWWVNE